MTVRQARARLCGAAVFPLLMAGCALFEPQEVIENRYKTLKVAPPETEAQAGYQIH